MLFDEIGKYLKITIAICARRRLLHIPAPKIGVFKEAVENKLDKTGEPE